MCFTFSSSRRERTPSSAHVMLLEVLLVYASYTPRNNLTVAIRELARPVELVFSTINFRDAKRIAYPNEDTRNEPGEA